MNLSFWSAEESMTLKEYAIEFPVYSRYEIIEECSSDEVFIKTSLIEQEGLGYRVEKITITKHEDFCEGEIKWSVESEELIWFNKMVVGTDIDLWLGLRGYELKESKWNEVILELKNFIKDIR